MHGIQYKRFYPNFLEYYGSQNSEIFQAIKKSISMISSIFFKKMVHIKCAKTIINILHYGTVMNLHINCTKFLQIYNLKKLYFTVVLSVETLFQLPIDPKSKGYFVYSPRKMFRLRDQKVISILSVPSRICGQLEMTSLSPCFFSASF